MTKNRTNLTFISKVPANVLVTEELLSRPGRQPDYAAENSTLAALADTLRRSPQDTLKIVAERARSLCPVESAGVSLYDAKSGSRTVVTKAAVGTFAQYKPRELGFDESAVTVVLESNVPQLFRLPGRAFPYLAKGPGVSEALYVPIHLESTPVGAIWAFLHSADRQFDLEDLRLLKNLASFTSTTYSIAGNRSHNDATDADLQLGAPSSKLVKWIAVPPSNKEPHQHSIHSGSNREVPLTNSDSRASRVFSQALVGLSEINFKGQFLSANDELARMLATSREKLIGMSIKEITHPEDYAASLSAMRRVIETGDSVSIDKRYVRSDGTVVWVHNRLSRLEDAAGVPYSILAVIEDRTARRRAEAALLESEEQFRGFFDNAAVGMALADPISGRFLRANKAFFRITGYEERELLGLTIRAITHPDEAQSTWRALHGALGVPGGRFQTEKRLGRKDGTTIWVRVNSSAVRGPSGEILQIAGVIEDISERVYVEEELRRARDELEIRVAERTKDLAKANEALRAEASERARAEAARRTLQRRLATSQEDERRRVARDLHDNVGQMTTALSLALKHLELAAGADPTISEPLANMRHLTDELSRALHDLAVRLRPTALDDLGLQAALSHLVNDTCSRAGIEPDFQTTGLDTERLPLEVETVIYRVVQEALTNIVRHSKAKNVSVIIAKYDECSVTVVEDDGEGFDADAEDEKPKKGRFGLLGMKERVNLVGGSLEIESTPGQGTTIVARLPLTGEII